MAKRKKKPMSWQRKRLLIELAQIMVSVHNPNTTVGRGHYPVGSDFAYTVTFTKGREEIKTKSFWQMLELKDDVLLTGRCVFGANELPVFENLNRLITRFRSNQKLLIDDESS